jgi:hypothetical protein
MLLSEVQKCTFCRAFVLLPSYVAPQRTAPTSPPSSPPSFVAHSSEESGPSAAPPGPAEPAWRAAPPWSGLASPGAPRERPHGSSHPPAHLHHEAAAKLQAEQAKTGRCRSRTSRHTRPGEGLLAASEPVVGPGNRCHPGLRVSSSASPRFAAVLAREAAASARPSRSPSVGGSRWNRRLIFSRIFMSTALLLGDGG